MELIATELPGVLLVRPTTRRDERGVVSFVWNATSCPGAALPGGLQLENHITSRQWVLRGIHRRMAVPQGKLVRCLHGQVFDVAVDLRPDSANMGRWVGRYLEGGSGEALWIPPGFGHGVLALTENAVFSIQGATPADPGDDERTLAWDDPTVAVDWPLPAAQRPILNTRDLNGRTLESFR